MLKKLITSFVSFTQVDHDECCLLHYIQTTNNSTTKKTIYCSLETKKRSKLSKTFLVIFSYDFYKMELTLGIDNVAYLISTFFYNCQIPQFDGILVNLERKKLQVLDFQALMH